MYNPYQNNFMVNPYNQTIREPMALIRVTGIEGAKAYQMPPNSQSALFDNNSDLMYIKITDGAGFGTVRVFKFEELKEVNGSTQSYVTREEFDEFRKGIEDGKFNIQSRQRNKSTDNQSS